MKKTAKNKQTFLLKDLPADIQQELNLVTERFEEDPDTVITQKPAQEITYQDLTLNARSPPPSGGG